MTIVELFDKGVLVSRQEFDNPSQASYYAKAVKSVSANWYDQPEVIVREDENGLGEV